MNEANEIIIKELNSVIKNLIKDLRKVTVNFGKNCEIPCLLSKKAADAIEGLLRQINLLSDDLDYRQILFLLANKRLAKYQNREIQLTKENRKLRRLLKKHGIAYE